MNTQEVLRQYLIQDLLSNHDSASLTADDNLLTSGLIDSLGIMRLVGFIEERFEVEIPPEDVTIQNFRTVNVITNYLESRQVQTVS